MEDQQRHNNNNNGGGGFLLGVMVGVAITLLFTTKKGREILKDTVNRALDKVNELQSTVEESVRMDDEDLDGDDYIKPDPAPSPSESVKEVRYLASEMTEAKEEPDEPKVKEAPPAEEPKTSDELKEKTTHERVEETPIENNVAEKKEEETEKEPTKKSSPVRKFFRLKKN